MPIYGGDYNDASVKMMYPWQGPGQQLNQSSLKETSSPLVSENADDSRIANQFNSFNNNNNLHHHNYISHNSQYRQDDLNQSALLGTNADDEVIIDQLIQNLNGKLSLHNNSNSCHSLCKERRLSPFSTTGHTVDCTNHNLLNESNVINAETGDAYRLMQQLLKEGSLIKEAVRRLQFNKADSPIAF